MNVDPYSPMVRSLFAQPAHAGTLPGRPCVLVEDQGIAIELAAQVQHGSIQMLRFRASGCPHIIAAAEWVCSHYEGEPAASLESFTAAELRQTLAVPVTKSGRIIVLEDAVRELGAAIRVASATTGQD